jgi:hypothetical protein
MKGSMKNASNLMLFAWILLFLAVGLSVYGSYMSGLKGEGWGVVVVAMGMGFAAIAALLGTMSAKYQTEALLKK